MADTRCPQCAGLRGYPKVIETGGKMKECADIFHTSEAKAPIEFPPPVLHSAVTRPPAPPKFEPPPQPDAKCPHLDCDADPISIFFNEFKFPDGRKAYLFYCTKCLKLVPAALQPVVIAHQ